MRRLLLRSNSFVRAAKRVVKKNPDFAKSLKDTLNLLEKDSFNHHLRTHKLKGKLGNSWACSAGHDLRIIFKFVKYEENEVILLETIGTHEEVY